MAADSERIADLRAAVTSAIGGEWAIEPLGGTSGRTFLATGPRSLVLRLGMRADVARRLSALHVSPAVVAVGSIGGEDFVLQEKLDVPVSVDPAWIRANRIAVAELLSRYLGDAQLGRLAPQLELRAYVELLVARLVARDPARESLGALLVQSMPPDGESTTAATHGDPNTANFLLSKGLWLVDWDDLARADPMRDIGQVAWWYLDEETWPSFVVACGQPPTAVRRIHWWAAVESLDVALRLADTDGEAAEAFLGDFDAAVSGRSNPRRG